MRNLTQADLAELAGVTRRSVNAIEAGRMVPSVLLALRLARALGVTRPVTSLGRQGADLTFPDDPYLSPLHAQIINAGGQVRVVRRAREAGGCLELSCTRGLLKWVRRTLRS